MDYRVRIVPSVEKELHKLPADIRNRIVNKISSLKQNPLTRGSKKLTGWGLYRLRVGDYRILYHIDNVACIITIAAVGHRREIYKFN